MTHFSYEFGWRQDAGRRRELTATSGDAGSHGGAAPTHAAALNRSAVNFISASCSSLGAKVPTGAGRTFGLGLAQGRANICFFFNLAMATRHAVCKAAVKASYHNNR